GRACLQASQRGEIARDGAALPVGQRLHELRHVEVVGSLLGGKGAHCRDQIFIAEPGQPRGRHATLEVRLMTGLALRDALRRQRRRDARTRHEERDMRANLMWRAAATPGALVLPPAIGAVRAEGRAALTGIVSSEAEGKMESVVVTARRPGSIVQVSVTTEAE